MDNQIQGERMNKLCWMVNYNCLSTFKNPKVLRQNGYNTVNVP